MLEDRKNGIGEVWNNKINKKKKERKRVKKGNEEENWRKN